MHVNLEKAKRDNETEVEELPFHYKQTPKFDPP